MVVWDTQAFGADEETGNAGHEELPFDIGRCQTSCPNAKFQLFPLNKTKQKQQRWNR